MNKFKIKLNGKEIEAEEGRTIFEVADANGIFIPTLCHHEDFEHKANCRVCCVEINGRRNLAMACATKITEGMEITTDSERVKKSRNLNIEMIFAEHIEKCATCIWRVNCKLLDLADRYKILLTTFKDRKGKRKIYKFANAVELDGTQCIDCRNCIDACSKMQKINHLKVVGKGSEQEIMPDKSGNTDCIYCGQCALHCPVGAAQEQAGWEDVEKDLKYPDKVKAVLISTATLVSVLEEFKMETTESSIKKVIAAIKKLGFNYVYDDGLANAIYALNAAKEIIKRPKKDFPLFTSYCPAWVKYVSFYQPDLSDHLLRLKSPQLEGGRMIKSYLAKIHTTHPSSISLTLINQCTSSKYDIMSRGDITIKHSITTRELAWLIKKNRIDINELAEEEINRLIDNDFRAVLGAESGGGIELISSALEYLSKKSKNDKLKKSSKLRYLAVNGIGNIKEALEARNNYDLIEVASCPDGCAGGGGGPIPTNEKLRKERVERLKKFYKNNIDWKYIDNIKKYA